MCELFVGSEYESQQHTQRNPKVDESSTCKGWLTGSESKQEPR
jgi:hypothetical protein